MSTVSKTGTAKPTVGRLTLHRETVQQMAGTEASEARGAGNRTNGITCGVLCVTIGSRVHNGCCY